MTKRLIITVVIIIAMVSLLLVLVSRNTKPTTISEKLSQEAQGSRISIEDSARVLGRDSLPPPEVTSIGRASLDTDVPGLTVVVLQGDEEPLTDTVVWIVNASGILGRCVTDIYGTARFAEVPESGGSLEVIVMTGWALRCREKVPSSSRLHRIVLSGPVSVVGKVFVNGLAPEESIDLSVRCDGTDGGLAGPPPELATLRGYNGFGGNPIFTIHTKKTGEFRIDGINERWSGSITPGHGYALKDGLEEVDVPRPQQDLVIELTRTPAITGRLVDHATLQPVSAARGVCDLFGPTESTTMEVLCNDGGRFRITLPSPSVERAQITFRVDGIGQCTTLIGPVPDEGIELGDLLLNPARDIFFQIRKEDGKGLSGATAKVPDATGAESQPTGEDGQGVLRGLPVYTQSIMFRAAGYEPIEHIVGPDQGIIQDPITVTLWRLPSLRVAIKDPTGTSMSDVNVVVISPDTIPFIGDKGKSRDVQQVDIGASLPSNKKLQGGDSTSLRLEYQVDGSGIVFIPAFMPDTAFEVRVEDRASSVLETRIITPNMLNPWCDLEFIIAAPSCELQVIVKDSHGLAVPRTTILRRDGSARLAVTNSEGAASIGPLYGPSANLFISKQGFAPTLLNDVALYPPIVRAEVILNAGVTVQLRVHDGSGTPAVIENVRVRYGEVWVGKLVASDGHSEIQDLPEAPVEIWLLVGGLWLSRQHEVGSTVEDIVIPPFGSVVIQLPHKPAAYETQLRLVSKERPEIALRKSLESGQEHIRFPVVFAGTYEVVANRVVDDQTTRSETIQELTVEPGAEAVVRLTDR